MADDAASMLASIDRQICSLAHSYNLNGLNGVDVADLVQEARLAAFKAHSVRAHPAYMFQSARNRVLNYVKMQKAKSRCSPQGMVYLDDDGRDKDSRSLHEVISLPAVDGERMGHELKRRFGECYALTIAANPKAHIALRSLLRLCAPEPNSNNYLTRRFFTENGLLPVLRQLYDNSVAKARADIFPELSPRAYGSKSPRFAVNGLDAWGRAASAVGAMWNSSDSIPDIRSQYCMFAECDEGEVFVKRSRHASVVPFRYGFAHLLLNGMGLDANYVKSALNASTHNTVSENAKAFSAHPTVVDFRFPAKVPLDYSWRVVCNALLKRDWKEFDGSEVMETYSIDVGVPAEEIVGKRRDEVTARARAGFFYLATEQLGQKQNAVINNYGFRHNRSVISHANSSVASALGTWRSIRGIEDRIELPDESNQMQLAV